VLTSANISHAFLSDAGEMTVATVPSLGKAGLGIREIEREEDQRAAVMAI
jgi:hypothetical protein